MTTATRKAEILKPAVLTYAEVRALKAAGRAAGRGDRVQVCYGAGSLTFRRRGGAWVAM